MAAISISILDFAKFVNATSASARVSIVAQAKDPYDPSHDFYKGLREAIVRGQVLGDPRVQLQEAIARARDPRRQNAYQLCGTEYLKFVSRRTVEWVAKPKGWTWHEGEVEVRVNPEAIFSVRGRDYLLKMWFSKKPLGQQGRRAVAHLLAEGAKAGQQPGLLDVRHGAISPPLAVQSQTDLFLRVEADALASMWRRIP
jgi:hypothetical protein